MGKFSNNGKAYSDEDIVTMLISTQVAGRDSGQPVTAQQSTNTF